jgi:4-azaleucine resistance transporter AzlC
MRSRSSEFWGGVRAQLPILLGTSPFGVIYGILAMEADLPVPIILAMSMIVFAGSSQFIAAELFKTTTPGLIIVLTTFVVNLRHMLYSASLAPYVKHLSKAWKYLLAYLLTDEAYVVTILHYEKNPRHTNQHWFFLGAGLTLWVSWQISTIVGVVVGTSIPESWSLDFALPLTFIALVIPVLRDRPTVFAALTAGVVAVVAYRLPYNLGLMAAVLAGIAAGVSSERRLETAHGERMNRAEHVEQ